MECFAVVAAFLAFGLGWAGLQRAGGAGTEPYLPLRGEEVREDEVPEERVPQVWLVDGYNVLCAGVLGGRDRTQWWSEGNRRELLLRAQGLGGGSEAREIWVAFDGSQDRPVPEPAGGSVRSVFVPSADDWLLQQVRERCPDQEVALVTGDRQLADRARHRGARVFSPREFLERCSG